MLINRRPLRVEWGHCDPAGIVFYPQYLIMMDSCTSALFDRTGINGHALRQRYGIIGVPIVDLTTKFMMPARYDDDLLGESGITQWGRASFTVHHRLTRDGNLIVEGFEKRVWSVPDPARPGEIKGMPVPPEVVAALSDPTGKTVCV